MTQFRMCSQIKESLLQHRIHCTQSNEMTSMVAEGESSADGKVEVWKFHEVYTDHLTDGAEAAIKTGIIRGLNDGDYPELTQYLLDPKSKAFPTEEAGGMLPDTVDQYIYELARDICTTVTISALDLIQEIEGWIDELNEHLTTG